MPRADARCGLPATSAASLLLIGLCLASTAPACAQEPRVGVEATAGWVIVQPGGIQDPGTTGTGASYASHWFEKATGGPAMSARLAVRLPLHLRLTLGYHLARFREAASDSTLLFNLYRIVLAPGKAKLDGFQGSSLAQGYDVGLVFAPQLPWRRLRPFVSVGLRQESLRSTTSMRASEIGGSGTLDASSELNTGVGWGSSFAAGLEVPIPFHGLALRVSVERNHVSPRVLRRNSRFTATLSDGTVDQGQLAPFVPQGQVLHMDYYLVEVGLQVWPFQ